MGERNIKKLEYGDKRFLPNISVCIMEAPGIKCYGSLVCTDGFYDNDRCATSW